MEGEQGLPFCYHFVFKPCTLILETLALKKTANKSIFRKIVEEFYDVVAKEVTCPQLHKRVSVCHEVLKEVVIHEAFRESIKLSSNFLFPLAWVVRKVDNTIQRINHYQADSLVCFVNTYPLDSDLPGGQHYPAFEQLGPGWHKKVCNGFHTEYCGIVTAPEKKTCVLSVLCEFETGEIQTVYLSQIRTKTENVAD